MALRAVRSPRAPTASAAGRARRGRARRASRRPLQFQHPRPGPPWCGDAAPASRGTQRRAAGRYLRQCGRWRSQVQRLACGWSARNAVRHDRRRGPCGADLGIALPERHRLVHVLDLHARGAFGAREEQCRARQHVQDARDAAGPLGEPGRCLAAQQSGVQARLGQPRGQERVDLRRRQRGEAHHRRRWLAGIVLRIGPPGEHDGARPEPSRALQHRFVQTVRLVDQDDPAPARTRPRRASRGSPLRGHVHRAVPAELQQHVGAAGLERAREVLQQQRLPRARGAMQENEARPGERGRQHLVVRLPPGTVRHRLLGTDRDRERRRLRRQRLRQPSRVPAASFCAAAHQIHSEILPVIAALRFCQVFGPQRSLAGRRTRREGSRSARVFALRALSQTLT